MALLDDLQQLPLLPLLLKAILILSTPFLLVLTVYFFLVPNALKDSRRRKLPPGP
ncbi:hypothetical protein EJ04DRAFT_509878, partial [Polyplosphaeria fusca]